MYEKNITILNFSFIVSIVHKEKTRRDSKTLYARTR